MPNLETLSRKQFLDLGSNHLREQGGEIHDRLAGDVGIAKCCDVVFDRWPT
jgi:hypothetical protein